jgi:trimeric autotransporter adhesin
VLPTFQSGFPVSIRQSSNPNSTIARDGLQRPNLVSNVALGTKGSLYDRLNGYINPAAFTASAAYTFWDAPRSSLCVDLGMKTETSPCSKAFSFVIG